METVNFEDIVGASIPPSPRKLGRTTKFRQWLIKLLSNDIIELEKKEDPEFFIRTAQELIGNNTQDEFILNTSRRLLVQQRIMDDTKARRRLERWARNTIIWYLVIVFLLVVLNGISQVLWPMIFPTHGFITDMVMTVILSTTTINIIGLGVIVLRGHFPSYGNEDNEKATNPPDKTNE